jgi:hypothetical protein
MTVLIRETEKAAQRSKGEDTEEEKMEVSGMWLPAKECQEPPEEGRGQCLSLQPSDGA